MNKIYKINVMIGDTERFFKGTIEKEDNDFVKKYETLTNDYREAVMNAGLPAQHTADENGGINKAKSLEEIIAETIKK